MGKKFGFLGILITLFFFVFSFVPVQGCDMLSFQGTVTSANNAQIAYTMHIKPGGSISAVPLVFVHGWACSQEYWLDQIDFMAEKHIVITIDLAGHGKSSFGNREKYTMESYAQDVISVINALHLRNVILIGHSMGASVILETALRLPERIIGLVGADSYHNVVQDMASPETMEPTYQSMMTDFKTAATQFLMSAFISQTPAELKQGILDDVTTLPPTVETAVSSLKELYNYYYNKKTLAAFNELLIPIRAINSAAYAYDISAGKNNTESFDMVHMSNVGHFLMMEDPVAFNSLLDKMIAEIVLFKNNSN